MTRTPRKLRHYNFICSANENQWETNPSSFPKYRVFEYTDTNSLSELFSGKEIDWARISDLPTIFAYEDMVGKDACVGNIEAIEVSADYVKIEYEILDDFLPISIDVLESLAFELDLHTFEFSRTHWAIKSVDLIQTLEQRGLRVPKSSQQPANSLVGYESSSQNKSITNVFISYSHADADVLERLRVHLKPLEERLDLQIWSDTQLIGGDDWKVEIEMGLSEASVAILIVSADFLASDFVTKFELPPLLEKQENEGCRIIPLIAKPCFFSGNSEISRFQSVNDPKESLLSISEAKREEVFSKVTQLVNDLVKQN